MKSLKHLYFAIAGLLLMQSCEIENLENENVSREDFTFNNYVLATEEASNSDITRFFTFEMEKVVGNTEPYELLSETALFTNSDPSTSAGHHSVGNYFFALAKDKKGMSSTPGIYRLSINRNDRIFINESLNLRKNNLFPSRKLCIADRHLGFYYNEGLSPQSIYKFDPYTMLTTGSIDLKEAIINFRPNANWLDESGNNMIRTGSLVLAEKEGKLYVSVVFLETVGFNIIADSETNFHLAVIDIASEKVEKIISYPNTRTVGFFVSENNPTTIDERGDMYLCSWGWNQFGTPTESKVFRIQKGETDFDKTWEFNIDKHFGKERIAQSIISYNNKIYLHISTIKYMFSDSDSEGSKIEMEYYELNPQDMSVHKLDIPSSNPSARMNVFSVIDNKLYICVPNRSTDKFNGIYSMDRKGKLVKEISIQNKYRPGRLYKLTN